MKAIVIDFATLQSIIQERALQTTEFEAGCRLVSALKGESVGDLQFGEVCAARNDIALFFISGDSKEKLLVFDVEQAPIFTDDPDTALLVFQRCLRFAQKIWLNQKFSPSERDILKSDKYALFPLPYSTKSGYRVTLQRGPDQKRTQKRVPGDHLLVFRHGTDDGGGPDEIPNYKNLRESLEGMRTVATAPPRTAESIRRVTEMPVEAVELKAISASLPSIRGFDKWLPLLTRTQREFVKRVPHGAERIEGPAGSGKTLCLILKCINTLLEAERVGKEHHLVLFAHSHATGQTIRQIFDGNDPSSQPFSQRARGSASVSARITTLQSWCAEVLGERNISPSEFLDRDALTSKALRHELIVECIAASRAEDLATHKKFLSSSFSRFLDVENWETLADMLEHEFAVVIKGRCSEDMDRYKTSAGLVHNLPAQTPSDRAYIFSIYRRYSEELRGWAQYDTDDVVLTAIGTLDTPIWRRRRSREGFDSVFIDETHYFNLNELSVFHFALREPVSQAIVFSVDRTQAVGDHGATNDDIAASIEGLGSGRVALSEVTKMRSLFRCSPQVTALALSVTASGASLFTTFDNPLEGATSAFTAEEERKTALPRLRSFADDHRLILGAIECADSMQKRLGCSRASILIVVFDADLFDSLKAEAGRLNKPMAILESRGDIAAVESARMSGKFVLSMPDYVGGLEFDGVVLVGVDKGRVPPGSSGAEESRHFMNYRSHNRLYVAITRARYAVDILVVGSRGPSDILGAAIENELIQMSS